MHKRFFVFILFRLYLKQGGNFGSAKSAFSDRRRRNFRSARIRSAEPSAFVSKIGESAKIGKSAKSGNRQKLGNRRRSGILGDVENLGVKEIRTAEKIGVGSGIGRRGLELFCRIGSRSGKFLAEISCRNCHPAQVMI